MITREQALEIAKQAMGATFDLMPEMTKLQAIMGIMVSIEAMKILGWRISPPLKEAK